MVETSLYETAIWTQASDYAITAVDRSPVRRRARHEMLTPTANRYRCGDNKWVVFNMLDAKAFGGAGGFHAGADPAASGEGFVNA